MKNQVPLIRDIVFKNMSRIKNIQKKEEEEEERKTTPNHYQCLTSTSG